MKCVKAPVSIQKRTISGQLQISTIVLSESPQSRNWKRKKTVGDMAGDFQ